MMKSSFRNFFSVLYLMILLSCENATPTDSKNRAEPTTAKTEVLKEMPTSSKIKEDVVSLAQISIDTLANRFIENIEQGKKLSSFFSDDWTFIYHADNRCEGSTDGKINHLKSLEIDKIITLMVKNDGEGWVCEKTLPKRYDLDFSLKKEVKSWDRFIIPTYEHNEKNIIYIIGKGESDYIKLHFNKAHQIEKLEYRSEDPG